MKTQVYQNRNPKGLAKTETGIPLGEWLSGHTFYLAAHRASPGDVHEGWKIVHEQSGKVIRIFYRDPQAAIDECKEYLERHGYRITRDLDKVACEWREIKAKMWANAERYAI